MSMLGVSVIVARVLGPTVRGQLLIVTTIGAISFLIGNLGIGSGNIYYAAKKHIPNGVLIGNSLVAGLVLGIVTALIAGSIVIAVPSITSGVPVWAVCAPLTIMPVAYIELYLSLLIIGHQRLKAASLLQLAARLASAGVAVIIVVTYPSVVAIAFAFQSMYIIRLLLNIAYMSRSGLLERPIFALTHLRTTVVFGMKGRGNDVFQYLNVRFDSLLVNSFLSPAAVGVYSLAAMLLEFAWYPSSAFAWVLFPQTAARTNDRPDTERDASYVRRMFWLSGLLVIVIAAVCVPSIPFIFGADFAGASTCLLILLPGSVAYSLSIMLSAALTGRGRPSYSSMVAAISFAVTIILDIILIPWLGIRGAAAASSVAYVVAAVAAVILFHRVTNATFFSILVLRRSDIVDLVALVHNLLRHFVHSLAHSLSRVHR